MPVDTKGPFTKQLLAVTSQTSTTTSAAIALPQLAAYAFHMRVTQNAGCPIVDVVIQIQLGTNYRNAPVRFAQMTLTAADETSDAILHIHPHNGALAGLESAVADTGGALSDNFPLTKNIKFKYTLAGTSVDVDIEVWVLGHERAAGGY